MSKIRVETILCLQGTMDNYAYLVIDEDTGVAAAIDAPEAEPIVKRCEELGVVPKYIMSTHHHFDHTQANLELKQAFGAKVVGAEYDKDRIPEIDIMVKDGDVFKVGNAGATVIKAEGHTTGHILYYFKESKVLFTGDVLFNLCVGGLFEGTQKQMAETLNKIKALPDDVSFYPGHEYTMHAIDFAEQISGKTDAFKEYKKLAEERLSKGLPVAPIKLGMEKKCNPYMLMEGLR